MRATVLPSMRKDHVYTTVVVFHESTARVASAHCACPAGLSGCCNHVTAMLYCLEEYIYLGLYEDELKGCTCKHGTFLGNVMLCLCRLMK